MSDFLPREASVGSAQSLWDLTGRPTRALIDLDAIASNAAALRAMVQPQAKLMAVVKANGYGHGAEMVARAALAGGADQLAVATVDEGVALRVAGLIVPILVLGPIHSSEIERALRHSLSLTLCSPKFARLVEQVAARLDLGTAVSCHVKVDTGMRRFGVEAEGAAALAQQVSDSRVLRLDGLFTHFADADAPDEAFTLAQASAFDTVLQQVRESGVVPSSVHAANSAALLRSRRYDYTMVRAGIALYGLPPSENFPLPASLRPAMSIRSTIGRIIHLLPGDSVGYGRTYRATEQERAALIPIGYADGYRRGLSSRGWMGVRGVRCVVAGRVSMDQTVVRLPEDVPVRTGEEVVVLGLGNTAEGAPSAVDLADLLGTIPYEVVTGIAARVPRFYSWRGRILLSSTPSQTSQSPDGGMLTG